MSFYQYSRNNSAKKYEPHLYAYDAITKKGYKGSKAPLHCFSPVKIKNAPGHCKLVYLMSFVASANGSHTYYEGSENEAVVNLL